MRLDHIRPLLLGVLVAFGAPSAHADVLGTAFTYQGELRSGGVPVNASCDFRFALLAKPNGNAVGAPQTRNDVAVTNGVFTTPLDFGTAFRGDAYDLQVAVKCGDEADFTSLAPAQAITAAPYALSLLPGTTIEASRAGPVLTVTNLGGVGVGGFGAVRAGLLGNTTDVNGSGVEGNADGNNAAGVFGVNTTGRGVWGRGTAGGDGVYGESSGNGVHGVSTGLGAGVFGTAPSAGVHGIGVAGVLGVATGVAESQGIHGEDGSGGTNPLSYAGYFNGRVLINGTLTKSAGTFRIDHPLDPANKFLSHSFVESPDMKNVYDGVVTLGADGTAEVVLPSYFAALNRDFRYQLTCIGGYAPVYVATEIADNRFTIGGGRAGLKVSWQVTGSRQDAFAEANPIIVEQDKGADRGRYLFPSGFGMPPEAGIAASSLPR